MKISGIVTTLVLCFITTATAGLYAEKDQDHSEQRLEKMKRHLKLSDAQLEQIKGIHKKFEPQREKLKTEAQAARAVSQELMVAESPDRAKIRAALEKSAKIRIDMRMLWIDQRLEMEQVLNPEQKKIWRAKMKERQAKMLKNKKGKNRFDENADDDE